MNPKDIDLNPFPNVGNNPFYNKEFAIGNMLPQINLTDNDTICRSIRPYVKDPTYMFELLDKINLETIQESSGDTRKYPVYIMLMHSGTALSSAIKGITHSEFSHSSISFDESMTMMYSFGRKADLNPFIGGFKSENINSEFFQSRDIPYALYVIPCTADQIRLMKQRLDFFVKNQSKFKYDFTGLFKNYFGIVDNPEYKWFCSRFVADIINSGYPNSQPIKNPSLVKPEDFKNMQFATYVTGGNLKDYNPAKVKQIANKIINNQSQIMTETTMKSIVDDNHKQKGKLKLSSFKKIRLTDDLRKKYSADYKFLKHFYGADETHETYAWFDKEELVGAICVSQPDKKFDGQIWLSDFEITPKYRGYGLSSQILDFACTTCKVDALGVAHDNEIARKLYEKHGFKYGDKVGKQAKAGTNLLMYKESMENIFEKAVKRINDKGEKIPEVCPKCGSKIGLYLKGEPVWLCSNKDCNKYFGTLPCNINESTHSAGLVFLSQASDWGENVISPRIPDNYMTQNGFEDNKTPRVCFSTSVSKALRALSQKCSGMELYVYTVDDGYKVITPTVSQVPDVELTDERWICKPCALYRVGKIKVIGPARSPGLPYKYGNKTAKLYDWTWKWLEYDGEDPCNGKPLIVAESVKRSELPDSVFGIPKERKYPMPDEKHTRSAMKLFNHCEKKYEEELAKHIIKNIKKYNIDPSFVGPKNRLRKYLIKANLITEGVKVMEDTNPILDRMMYEFFGETTPKSDADILFEKYFGEASKSEDIECVPDKIEPMVKKLENKKYRVKYASPGHANTKFDNDKNKDGVINGKMVSTGRIIFERDYHFDGTPDGWEWKTLSNGFKALYVKPFSYNGNDGKENEAFHKWQNDYLSNLNKWIESLPMMDSENPRNKPEKDSEK